MSSNITIINKIDLEEHLDRTWGDQPYRRESEEIFIQKNWEMSFKEIENHFSTFPSKVSFEISGHPLLFRIRIARCAWLLRPFLWFKLRRFLMRNRRKAKELEEQHRMT